MKMNAEEALATARAICLRAKLGDISYEECKKQCEPFLRLVNKTGKKISLKYNRVWKPITITGLLR